MKSYNDYGPLRAIQDGVIPAPTIVGWDRAADRDAASLEMIVAHLQAHPGPGVVSATSVEDATAFCALLAEVWSACVRRRSATETGATGATSC